MKEKSKKMIVDKMWLYYCSLFLTKTPHPPAFDHLELFASSIIVSSSLLVMSILPPAAASS